LTVYPVTFDITLGISLHPYANPFWVSETALAVPIWDRDSPGPETLYWMYDVHDLGHPKPVRLPAMFPAIDPEYDGMYDESSRTLVFVSTDNYRHSQEILAYDRDGLRSATTEEKERFETVTSARRQGNEDESTDAPVVEVAYLKRRHSFDRIFPRFGWLRCREYEIVVDGKRAKVTKYDPEQSHILVYHKWDPLLQLIFFPEEPVGDEEGWYYMDRYGHYRFWHTGRCIFKYRGGIKMGILRPGKNE
jgi:hypothetical protein